MPYVYRLIDHYTRKTQDFVSTEVELSLWQQKMLQTLLVNAKSYSKSHGQAIQTAIKQFNESYPDARMEIHDPNIRATIDF